MWLTKDEMGNTAQLSPAHERGYYIVWDTVNWHKERVSSPQNSVFCLCVEYANDLFAERVHLVLR